MCRQQSIKFIGKRYFTYNYDVLQNALQIIKKENNALVFSYINQNEYYYQGQLGLAGVATGVSMYGLNSLIHLNQQSFFAATDHLVNSCAKLNYMSSGILQSNLVYLVQEGQSKDCIQFSQSFANFCCNIPGLEVQYSFSPFDLKYLIINSFKTKNPKVILYNEQTLQLSQNDSINYGNTQILKKGNKVSVICYGLSTYKCLQINQDIEVINIRSLKPLDFEPILQSIKKTNRLIIVEEAFPQSGIASEIIAKVNETEAYNYLDCHIERITWPDTPLGFQNTISIKQIEKTIKKVLQQ